MNQRKQASEKIYEQLLNEVGPKAITSLKRLKAACDQIEEVNGLLNYSTIAKLATRLFGGPKPQSIHNNKKLKEYLSLRIDEYNSKNNSIDQKLSNEPISDYQDYPVENIDIKTKVYIDILHEVNARLEKENKYLSQLLKEESHTNPISLAQAISAGAENDGSMLIRKEQAKAPVEVLEFLHSIMGLNSEIGRVSEFKIQARDQKKRIVCIDGGIEQTILNPSGWIIMERWLKEIAS